MRWLSQVLAAALATLYCAAFFAHAPHGSPEALRAAMASPKMRVVRLLRDSFREMGVASPGSKVIDSVYLFLLAGVVPWFVMALLRRGGWHDLGCRRPNRYGWRLALVGFLLSIPFLAWMVGGVEIEGYYLRQFRAAGAGVFLGYYFVNMGTEHFFFHGVLLAAFRSDRRWPSAPTAKPIGEERGWLQWLGMAQTVHDQSAGPFGKLRQWLGLPTGCGFAIVGSAILFGFIHLGKDVRELILSIPGGAALGILAYRTNSWLTPLVLHLATAGTAFLIILARQ
jgi:hypothetical protein